MLTYKINPRLLMSGTTASTINIPINIQFQPIDNGEAIETDFVDNQVAAAINPILDYEKIRIKPCYDSNATSGSTNGSVFNQINSITYQLYFLSGSTMITGTTYYSDIGFVDNDIIQEKNYFTQSYLYLRFFDSDNTLNQNLITDLEIYSALNDSDYSTTSVNGNSAGYPKSASQIPVRMIVTNPLRKSGFFEGYHIYDYKDNYDVNIPNYLYMRASFINAKTGTVTNLMTSDKAYTIDNMVNYLFTRYKLYKNQNGFYYELDTTYSSNIEAATDITTNLPNIKVKLYQIQTL